MSNASDSPMFQPDEEDYAGPVPLDPIVAAEKALSDELAQKDAQYAEVIPLTIVEEYYKRPGGTTISALFGADFFDFWVGRFFVGFWGAFSMAGIVLGVLFYFYQVLVVEGTFNLLAARIDPPPIANGLALPTPGSPGFTWFIIVIAATISFIGWLMRQVDLSRKLAMGYEIPIAYGAVVSSWLTLQWFRPIAMGSWGNGFPLGITHHLDWVSNVGYNYYNFFYNPFHAAGVSLLFASTLFLAMHGSAIWSSINRPGIDVRHIDAFWRGILGYSVGEIGIHRIAFWFGAASVISGNLCIFLSGTFVQNWSSWWSFWDKLPVWNFEGTGWGLIIVGVGAVVGGGVANNRRRRSKPIDIDAVERGGTGIEANLGRPFNIGAMNKLFGSGQIGPFYIGVWGMISIAFGSVTGGIILLEFLYKVGYNPLLFARQFFSLSLDPPASIYGLSWAPYHQGGAWLLATLFLHFSVLAWLMRLWTRAQQTGLGKQLFWGFAAALSLYFVIYLIRPILIGTWSGASGHGFKALLDWTNNVSILYGNFYYNPFHMISVFFLLGSTLLLAMHGATICATARYGSELEVKEAEIEGPGTHRSQLFWRWCMGFNANAASIHYWAWWFAALCGLSGAVGLLLSGTVIHDWYAWANSAHIVAPPAP